MNLSCLNVSKYIEHQHLTVKFSIKSLEIHRISSEILPSSGSPSFTASLRGQRGLGFPGHGGAS